VSKVGKFLIARPAINSGFFKRSVVFVYEDSTQGTVGLNLTTPSNLTLKAVDPEKTVDYSGVDPVIYLGGPVNDRAVMMLHSDDFVSTNTLFTDSGLNVSSDNLMVDKMFAGDWPALFRLTVGASVWAPGQLDYEINQKLWLISEMDHSPVFELSGDDLWNWAIEHVGSRTMARYF
jgi:putative transcriptional regulator